MFSLYHLFHSEKKPFANEIIHKDSCGMYRRLIRKLLMSCLSTPRAWGAATDLTSYPGKVSWRRSDVEDSRRVLWVEIHGGWAKGYFRIHRCSEKLIWITGCLTTLQILCRTKCYNFYEYWKRKYTRIRSQTWQIWMYLPSISLESSGKTRNILTSWRLMSTIVDVPHR